MITRILQLGCHGEDVAQWQHFLLGYAVRQGALESKVDGDFGATTFEETRRFQRAEGVAVDGRVGNETLQRALAAGFALLPDAELPPRPEFTVLADSVCDRYYGRFGYTAGQGDDIVIDPKWVDANIVTINVPLHPPLPQELRVHRLAAERIHGLFEDWARLDLIGRIVSSDGAFVQRRKRGSSSLSRHAYGLAFDINAFDNAQGYVPAQKGVVGCVRELVPAATKRGVFWGGFFHHIDPMHFEVAMPPGDGSMGGPP